MLMPEYYVKTVHFFTCSLNEDIDFKCHYPSSCDVHVNMMMGYIN